MLYLAIRINIFPKYNFQGKKFTVIAISPKHTFLRIMDKTYIQVYLKTNIYSLTRLNPKFHLPMLAKALIWRIRVTNGMDLFSRKVLRMLLILISVPS